VEAIGAGTDHRHGQTPADQASIPDQARPAAALASLRLDIQ
jgi:hypothetical protein